MKKQLAIFVLLMLALLLAACGDDKDKDEKEGLSAANQTQTAEAELPTATPTEEPIAVPTDTPTVAPTATSTQEPTGTPTQKPSDTPAPTATPTSETSGVSAQEPTEVPTDEVADTPVPAATATSETTGQEPTPSAALKTLTIGTTDRIAKLDPADAYSFHDWELLRNVSDGLLAYVPGSTDIEPRLAVDFPTVSEDGLVYTFKLRPDAKFPDGTALTAQMYVEWANRSLTLKGDPYGLISVIQSVAVGENEDEVVFTLSKRFDLFPITIASQPQLMPFAPGNYPADAINNQPATVQGVGPYQIVSYTIGEQTILEANPNYYGEPPAYGRVIFVYFQDAAQLTLAIESGDVDVAWRSVTPTEVNRLSGIDKLSVLTLPGQIQYLLFNHQSEIGGNASIRQAIAKLVERDEIIDRALSGLANPIYSMVPPGFDGAAESFLERYGFNNVEGAVADLEAAGYSEDNKLVLDLWYPPERYGTEMPDAVTVIKQQLEASGLITVNLQSVEWSTYIEAATNGDYPFYVLGWFFDYPDADNYLHPFASCEGSPGLGANYCNEHMDELINNERGLVGSAEREQALKDLQDFYAEQVVSVPLWVRQIHLVYDNTSVTGVVVGAPLVLEYRLLSPVQ